MKKYELVVIGGGPAGLAAALAAREKGVKDIVILERDRELGGILNQCIHNGFGLHTFGEELTGPEYAQRFIKRVLEEKIVCKLETMVLEVGADRVITAINPKEGVFQIQASAVILAMGCRERPRGALQIPGSRPFGVFTAGTMQRLVNMEGYRPGKEVVILGSGDIGLIMARRMVLEGASVKAVLELQPYCGGLKRNIVQCLDDFGIPLRLCHTVVKIQGKDRLTGVVTARVDEKGAPVLGTEEWIPCDTLLLSCGLIPECDLLRETEMDFDSATKGPKVTEKMQTSLPGFFACGNVLHVHDLVDFVSEEAALAGRGAADFVQGKTPVDKQEGRVVIHAGTGVRYTVPMCFHGIEGGSVTVRFRVDRVYKGASVAIYADGILYQKKKKRILAPGEMETLTFQMPGAESITIQIQEDA